MGLLNKIISRFPRGGISYVFAYGSAIKQQMGYEEIDQQKNNVIDLIFCVRDSLGWHAENIDRHPSHYSMLQFLGATNITRYQERLGASVYFNTLVPLPDVGVTIKYGVVSQEHLIDDLLHWKYLYLAGRLQKPVCDIVPPTHDEKLVEALNENLRHAFQVALLLLPAHFNAFELFHTISNLSYKGDFRMIFGENKHKVQNIVKPQLSDFLDLYRPAMGEFADYVGADFKAKQLGNNKNTIIRFEQDKSEAAIEYHLRRVPIELRKRLTQNAAFRGSYVDIVEQLSKLSNLSEVVQVSVNDIVWKSSITQSLKNIPSAGLLKSLQYSYRKALKTFAD